MDVSVDAVKTPAANFSQATTSDFGRLSNIEPEGCSPYELLWKLLSPISKETLRRNSLRRRCEEFLLRTRVERRLTVLGVGLPIDALANERQDLHGSHRSGRRPAAAAHGCG